MSTATADQLAALVFPALPSVVRLGTPVVHPQSGKGTVVIGACGEGAPPIVFLRDIGKFCRLPACSGVDLTDATGRLHTAWALASYSKNWPTAPDYTTATWQSYGGFVACVGLSGGHWWPWSFHVIAHLNPNDDTRLPDNSLWVEVEAMRLIGLHYLTGDST